MVTMTLTEFNQNPSRVVRLVEADPPDEIRVTKRGQPIFTVMPTPRHDDPIAKLIDAGFARAPVTPASAPLVYDDEPLPKGVDLTAALDEDRGRLD